MNIQLNRTRQRGIAMFVSLVVLLLMSMIILMSARASVLELFLGNNSQFITQSLMRAEDSVVAGETVVEKNYSGAPAIDFSTNEGDELYLDGEIDVQHYDWETHTQSAGEVEGNQIIYYAQYVVEYIGPTPARGGSLSLGAGASSDTRYLYRVSGRGGANRGSNRIVQTIYATAE